MKKIFFGAIMAFLPLSIFAQEYKNEVKLNVLNAIINPSIEIGYEYYLDDNQSVDAELFFLDKFSYWPKEGGKFNAFSFKVGYNYYFNSIDEEGFYVNPFIKARFGDWTKDNEVKKLDAFIFGVGAGYSWVFNNKFVVAPYVNIARNFSSAVNDEYWAIEPNAGIRFGFRF
ncbi:MAG: DUF3575 domain-containing protein [Capnocytophaga sp.]|nr:DUF3575 domain-containing protein [Capnocytophaga sp.]